MTRWQLNGEQFPQKIVHSSPFDCHLSFLKPSPYPLPMGERKINTYEDHRNSAGLEDDSCWARSLFIDRNYEGVPTALPRMLRLRQRTLGRRHDIKAGQRL